MGVVELVYGGIIAGQEGTELANLVAAGAFIHRTFTWLMPILVGLIPLAAWRKQMKASSETGSNGIEAVGEAGAG